MRRKNLIKRAVIESVCYNQRPGAVNCYCTSVTRVNLAPGVGILLIQLCNLVFPPPSFNYHYHKMKWGLRSSTCSKVLSNYPLQSFVFSSLLKMIFFSLSLFSVPVILKPFFCLEIRRNRSDIHRWDTEQGRSLDLKPVDWVSATFLFWSRSINVVLHAMICVVCTRTKAYICLSLCPQHKLHSSCSCVCMYACACACALECAVKCFSCIQRE